MKTRPLALALAAALLALTVSCGVDAGETADGGTATTEASDDTTATTAADDDEPSTTEGTDDEPTTTEEADDEPTTTEGTDDPDPGLFTEEQLAELFEQQGLPAEQADCVAAALIDSGFMDGGMDPEALDPTSPGYQTYIDAVQECILGS